MSGSTFSYAQAAQGLVASKSTSNQPSNLPTVVATPAKAPVVQTNDAESNQNGELAEQTNHSNHRYVDSEAAKPSRSIESSDFEAKPNPTESTGTISPPTRDMIEASIATLHREDDTSSSSIPNASSESTWENVSQASAVAEKGSVATDKVSKEGQKDQGNSKDESWIKPKTLKEAPIPTVNVWKSRMQSQPIKAPISAVHKTSVPNGITTAPQSQPHGPPLAPTLSNEKKGDSQKGVRGSQAKRDTQTEEEQSRLRRSSTRKTEDAPKAIPPPLKDETSWPTPELAQDERKKSLDKGEKAELPKITKKSDWKKVEIRHDIVWNTPMPNPAARRGGRATGRGGRDMNNTRTSPPNTRSGLRGGDSITLIDTSKRANGQEIPSPTRPRRSLADEGAARRHVAGNKENSRRENISPIKASAQEKDVSPAINGAPQVRYQSSGKGKKPDAAEVPKHDADPAGINVSSASQNAHANQQSSTDEVRPQNGESTVSKPVARHVHQQSNRRGSVRGRGGFHGFQGHHATPTTGYGMSPNLAFKSPPIAQEPYWGANPAHQTFRPQRTANGMNDRYGKYQNGYGNGSTLPPLNIYAAAPFQYQGHAMSAVPYGPMFDQYSLLGALSIQLEYYFSLENVLHDMYLRKHMDSQGWIDLEFIAKFKRVQNLTLELNIIKTAGQNLASVEYSIGVDGKSRVRRKGDWKQWVLPIEQRDPSAQHDGAEAAPIPPQSYPVNLESHMYGSRQASLPLPLASPNQVQQYNGQMYGQHGQYFIPHHGEQSNQRFQSSSQTSQSNLDHRAADQATMANGVVAHHGGKANGIASDVVSDSQVNGLMLMTRSSVDLNEDSNATGPDGSKKKHSQEPIAADSHGVNGTSTSNEGALIWPPLSDCSTIHLSPTRSRSYHSSTSSLSQNSSSPIDAHRLPALGPNIQPHSERYEDVRANALEQRRLRASPTDYPPDMAVLYQFWSHYLVHNFNSRMFEEFHNMAEEDFARFDNVIGMHNLANYFAGALVHNSAMPTTALECLVRLAQIELATSDPRLRTLRTLQIIWQQKTINTHTKISILKSSSIEPALIKALEATPAAIIVSQTS